MVESFLSVSLPGEGVGREGVGAWRGGDGDGWRGGGWGGGRVGSFAACHGFVASVGCCPLIIAFPPVVGAFDNLAVVESIPATRRVTCPCRAADGDRDAFYGWRGR